MNFELYVAFCLSGDEWMEIKKNKKEIKNFLYASNVVADVVVVV